MNRFDPITASEEIKQSFIDYITTSLRISDAEYAKLFRKELEREGFVAKGPYLDISGSYKTGATLHELMAEGVASPLFEALEPIEEQDRELQLDRPLYTHQEQALRKADAGRSLVVTTGTGSGKTECFLIPVINALLREKEQGKLDNAVRAIVIYPMNALANDQMKRMRKLLKNYPDITFGLYNGNTRHTQSDAEADYKRANGKDRKPLENELISRERMQEKPPHILITNYSMMEYMMLRPKDDRVFSGAKLRFIILDEAHIYKGTTGMETAMLMRRLRARISTRDTVQYILTSATLGGKEADGEITQFAKTLCDVPFCPEDIIRSEDGMPPMKDRLSFPPELFSELADGTHPVSKVLAGYQAGSYAQGSSSAEQLYDLLLHSDLFAQLVSNTRSPVSLSELCRRMNGMRMEQVKDLITVCTMAEKDGSSLIKARYHFFVRALEGAYITLNTPKQLFLQRQEMIVQPDGKEQKVFEIAVCPDCGRLALAGKINMDGYLKQVARKTERDPKACDYFLLVDKDFEEICEDEADEESNADPIGENDFAVCACCGKLGSKADLRFGSFCECDSPEHFYLKRVERTKTGIAKCPACGFGNLRAFYLGGDAATSVLGTELFEQLPDQIVKQPEEQEQNEAPAAGAFKLFSASRKPKQIVTHNMRQFLCFSDSRSEAAFFANYMEKSYQEFLRRRAILHVSEKLKEEGITKISVPAFVRRLTRFFDEKKTFLIWKPETEQHRED
ncbi:MAG: DEAD/DEAH box helicase, partial [Oscillospiraceae bacterium]|nr:DEAD/DEAH box helicase [Oscillospiraceae bacterium]